MSEPGIGSEPAGSRVRGVFSHVPCASCQHHHRVTDYGDVSVTYDIACGECGCTANGSDYDRGTINTTVLDDYYDDGFVCATHHIGGKCSCDGAFGFGSSDARAKNRMEQSGDLRRGWVDRFVWFGLSRFFGDFSSQLVREWGYDGRYRGRPDRGGGANPIKSAGSVELRGVVNP